MIFFVTVHSAPEHHAVHSAPEHHAVQVRMNVMWV